jgi:hypothetical protein
LRRDVFELVRFVDDEDGSGRNHLAVRALPHRSIRTQQMVIDDHHVGLRRPLPHQRDEAVAVSWAVLPETRVHVGGDLFPERQIFGKIAQLRAIAGRRRARPIVDDRQEHWSFGPFGPFESFVSFGSFERSERSERSERFERLFVDLPAMQAEIVRSPLHDGRGEGDAERVAQRRQVLEEDLLLQVLRPGRDEDALPAEDRGNQIGERFSGAGPRLRQQRPALFDRRGNRGGHAALPITWLVAVDGARQCAAGGKRCFDCGGDRDFRVHSE